MPNIDIFYGITTTTLIVLSSTTLVVFKYFIDAIQSAAKLCEDSIKQLDDKEQTCNQKVLGILGSNSKTLSLKYENLSISIVWEYIALFLVIFLSSISILLTLINGVFDFSMSIKWILSINLLSIIIYIVAFVGLFLKVQNKKKSLKTITTESEMFIKSIDDTSALYRALNENK